VLSTIFSRRSIRSYLPNEVDSGTVKVLLEAAVLAPTAMHEEPWAFVIVQNRQTLKQLSDLAKPLFLERLHYSPPKGGQMPDASANPDFDIFHGAGILIIICSQATGPFVEADCWLAAENMMLEACALGLGSCVIGSATAILNTTQVKAMLGIPAEFDAVAPIILGVPREIPAPTSRNPPLILAWNQ